MSLDVARQLGAQLNANENMVISLPHSKRTLGLAPCPDVSGGEANLHVAVGVCALVELETKTAEMMRDAKLSELGKSEKLAAPREAAVTVAARCWQNLADYAADVAEREAELYAVPQIPPSHSAEAAIDGEIRHFIRSLTGEERTKFLTEIGEGKHQRITLALCRSPVPIGIPEQVAMAAWRQSIALENVGTVAGLQVEHLAVEWGRSALAAVAKLVAESTGLKRAAIFRLAKDEKLDGLDAFGFSATEKANLARVAEAMKKRAA
jgi:hypothetical protein